MTTIDRTGCDATRHGDMSAYVRYRCRCTDACTDHYLYYKRLRNGQPYRRRIDATGPRRRIRALYAIGHTCATIAHTAGLHPRMIQQLGTENRLYVTPATFKAVADAYTRLAHTTGTSPTTAKRAAWWGYPPPAAWGDDIDDPAADPAAPRDPDHVDDVLVEKVLAGKASPKDLSKAERIAVVDRGLAKHVSMSRLGQVLSASHDAIRELAAANQAAA